MIDVVLCDDSSTARKQLLRALPEDWPVTLHQASDGEQALDFVRSGKCQVLFLDLTMPVLDGYQTLARLREEGLSCQVIVVSGDVQDQAVVRVMNLGARAFIGKPAAGEVISRTLQDLGLYQPAALNSSSPLDAVQTLVSVSFRDALREVTNVAIGRSAALLSKVLGVFVQLPVPQVNLFEVSELHMTLLDAQRGEQYSAICQGFIGEAIAGEALLLFHDSELADMAQLLGRYPEDEVQTTEMLLDLASILIGACLAGIAEQLDLRFSQSHPQLLGHRASLDELITVNRQRWRQTLAVEISYSLEGHAVHFDLLLLFTEDSVARLTNKVSYLME